MKLLMISVFAISLTVSSASHALHSGPYGPSGVVTAHGAIGPSGSVTGQGAIGPSGTVTGYGAIGPNGLPNGAVSRAIAATRGVAALAGGHSGAILAVPAIGTRALGVAGLTRANAILAAPATSAVIAPVGLGFPVLNALATGHGGAVLTAPSTVTTINGPSVPATVLTAPSSTTTIIGASVPAVATIGLGAAGIGAGITGGLNTGVGLAGIGSASVITNGGGAIGLSGHGVSVRGPPTAPAVIAGPSGKIAADGLWGPTATWASGSHGVHGW